MFKWHTWFLPYSDPRAFLQLLASSEGKRLMIVWGRGTISMFLCLGGIAGILPQARLVLGGSLLGVVLLSGLASIAIPLTRQPAYWLVLLLSPLSFIFYLLMGLLWQAERVGGLFLGVAGGLIGVWLSLVAVVWVESQRPLRYEAAWLLHRAAWWRWMAHIRVLSAVSLVSSAALLFVLPYNGDSLILWWGFFGATGVAAGLLRVDATFLAWLGVPPVRFITGADLYQCTVVGRFALWFPSPLWNSWAEMPVPTRDEVRRVLTLLEDGWLGQPYLVRILAQEPASQTVLLLHFSLAPGAMALIRKLSLYASPLIEGLYLLDQTASKPRLVRHWTVLIASLLPTLKASAPELALPLEAVATLMTGKLPLAERQHMVIAWEQWVTKVTDGGLMPVDEVAWLSVLQADLQHYLAFAQKVETYGSRHK